MFKKIEPILIIVLSSLWSDDIDIETRKVLQNGQRGGTEQILSKIFLIPCLYILEKKIPC